MMMRVVRASLAAACAKIDFLSRQQRRDRLTNLLALAALVVFVGFALAPGSARAAGACCLGDGTCVVTDGQPTCMSMGGVYQGDGSSCTNGSAPCELSSEFTLLSTGVEDLGNGLWRYSYRLTNLSAPADEAGDGLKRKGRFFRALRLALKLGAAVTACYLTGGNPVVCAVTVIVGIILDPAGETTDQVISLEFPGDGLAPGGYSEFTFESNSPPGQIEYELTGYPLAKARAFIVGPLPLTVGTENQTWGSLKSMYGSSQ